MGSSQEPALKTKGGKHLLATTNYALVTMEQTGIVSVDIDDSKIPVDTAVTPEPSVEDDSLTRTPERHPLLDQTDDASSPIISRSQSISENTSLRLELESSRLDSPVIKKSSRTGSLTSKLFDSMGLESDVEDEEPDNEAVDTANEETDAGVDAATEKTDVDADATKEETDTDAVKVETNADGAEEETDAEAAKVETDVDAAKVETDAAKEETDADAAKVETDVELDAEVDAINQEADLNTTEASNGKEELNVVTSNEIGMSVETEMAKLFKGIENEQEKTEVSTEPAEHIFKTPVRSRLKRKVETPSPGMELIIQLDFPCFFCLIF